MQARIVVRPVQSPSSSYQFELHLSSKPTYRSWPSDQLVPDLLKCLDGRKSQQMRLKLCACSRTDSLGLPTYCGYASLMFLPGLACGRAQNSLCADVLRRCCGTIIVVYLYTVEFPNSLLFRRLARSIHRGCFPAHSSVFPSAS